MHVLRRKNFTNTTHASCDNVQTQTGSFDNSDSKRLSECSIEKDVTFSDNSKCFFVRLSSMKNGPFLQRLDLDHLNKRFHLGTIPNYLDHYVLVSSTQLREQLDQDVYSPSKNHSATQNKPNHIPVFCFLLLFSRLSVFEVLLN